MRAPTFFFCCRRTKPVLFTTSSCSPGGMKGWQGGGLRALTTLVEAGVWCQWVQGALCLKPDLG